MKTVHLVARPLALVMVVLLAAPALYGQEVIRDLTRADNQYDYVIIAPAAYLSTVTPLAEFRAAHDAMRVGIALSDSIYRSYGASVAPDSAIKRFIFAALSTWASPVPRYFLIAGNMDAIPSHHVQSPLSSISDEDSVYIDSYYFIGSLAGGPIRPVVALGRFPARNAAELGTMVQKTIAYELAATGDWSARSIAVADSLLRDGPIWENFASAWQGIVRPRWSQTIDVHLRPSSPSYASRERFRELWGQGTALMFFAGHANWYEFSFHSYFTSFDVDSLADNSPLSVCFLLGSQRYERTDTVALALALLAAPSKGSVAVVAPTGLVFSGVAEDVQKGMGRNLAAVATPRIGDAFLSGLSESFFQGDQILARWTLFGDPALAVKNTGLAGIRGEEGLPSDVMLYPGYPNPFNPATTITFALPRDAETTLEVYSILGTKVSTLVAGRLASGLHRVEWNARGYASGIYFCRLSAEGKVVTRRLVLAR